MTLSISGEIAGLALEYNLYITGRSSAYIAFLEITASNQKWTDLLKNIKSVFFSPNPIFVKIVGLEHLCWRFLLLIFGPIPDHTLMQG